MRGAAREAATCSSPSLGGESPRNGRLSSLGEALGLAELSPGRDREEIREISRQMQAANRDEEKYLPPFRKFFERTGQGSATIGNGIYTMMDKDGYYYAGWGTSVYKVGDVRNGDVHSPIEIVKSYDLRDGLPEDQRDKISRIFGLAMMYDGHLAIAMPGIIAVMDRDFVALEDQSSRDHRVVAACLRKWCDDDGLRLAQSSEAGRRQGGGLRIGAHGRSHTGSTGWR